MLLQALALVAMLQQPTRKLGHPQVAAAAAPQTTAAAAAASPAAAAAVVTALRTLVPAQQAA
jgi:hypothetical protein